MFEHESIYRAIEFSLVGSLCASSLTLMAAAVIGISPLDQVVLGARYRLRARLSQLKTEKQDVWAGVGGTFFLK